MARGKKLQTAIPEFGFIYQPSYKYKGETKKSAVWWMRYRTTEGEQCPPEATGERDQRKAFERLQARYDTYRRGELQNASALTVTCDELLVKYLAKREKYTSYTSLKARAEKYVSPRWGTVRAMAVTAADVEEWANGISALGREDATVNSCISILHGLLQAGTQTDPPLVLRIPAMPWRELDNARQGLISHEHYESLREVLPFHMQVAVVIAYHTGLRKGLVLSLLWDWVDLKTGVISIPEPGKGTKTRPRHVPIWGDMRAWLEMASARRIGPYVVEWDGERVYDFRHAWERGCRLAGIPGALFHDFRRTAATRLHDDLGLDRSEIKRIVGWKTDAMFERYFIGSAKHTAKIGERLDARLAEQKHEKPTTTRRTVN